MLFEPERHESLRECAWDETRARETIARIVAEAERVFDPERLWPVHPLDGPGPSEVAQLSLYLGAPGVFWAIDFLTEQGVVQKQRDWAPVLEPLLESARESLQAHPEFACGCFFGEAGIALVGHRVTRSGVWFERMRDAARGNLHHRSNELFVGTPGTLLAAAVLCEETGDGALHSVVEESAERVLLQLRFAPEHGCSLWTQEFGASAKMLGLAHGFAGNACALLRAGRARALDAEIERTLDTTALTQPGLANWPQSVGPPRPGRTAPLVQICHGAPGVIVALARLAPRPG